MKYKKIENTRLHWIDLEYCSKQSGFSFLPLHFGNLLCSPKIGSEWRKKQLQSRWNEERGTLLGDKKEMQIKREETFFQWKSPEKNVPQVFRKGLLLSIHPSWVHESHSILFSSLHLYLQ